MADLAVRKAARPAKDLQFEFNELIYSSLSPLVYDVAIPKHPMEVGVKDSFLRFVTDESGATAIEYGLIAAGIALAIIAVVNGLGSNLNTQFASINSSLK